MWKIQGFVTFLGKDAAPDFQIGFSSNNGKQMLLLSENRTEAIHSVSQRFALEPHLTLEIFQFRDIASSGREEH